MAGHHLGPRHFGRDARVADHGNRTDHAGAAGGLAAGRGAAAAYAPFAAVLSPQHYRPLVYALAVNVLFHSAIAQKDYRFIWIGVLAALILAAITSVSVMERSAKARGLQLGWAAMGLLALGCHSNGVIEACTFVWLGTCTPDPYWTYQAALERERL